MYATDDCPQSHARISEHFLFSNLLHRLLQHGVVVNHPAGICQPLSLASRHLTSQTEPTHLFYHLSDVLQMKKDTACRYVCSCRDEGSVHPKGLVMVKENSGSASVEV